MSLNEVTAYVTTYLAANRPKDGRTPTAAQVRAVVVAALEQTCGDTCDGEDGLPGAPGAPGAPAQDGTPGQDGAPGKDAPPPTSVTAADIDNDGHLILTLSNGAEVTRVDAGALPAGPTGAKGDRGEPPVQWVTKRADGSTETCKRDDRSTRTPRRTRAPRPARLARADRAGPVADHGCQRARPVTQAAPGTPRH